jgi:hypothetical protein
LLLSCFRNIRQGVIKIKEWHPPSTLDLLNEMKSSGTLSDLLSELVNYLIDKEDNADLDSVSVEFIISPCKDLPTYDVAGQDTIRPSQAEFVNPKPPRKSTETISSTSTLGGQQNKGKGAKPV